MAAGWSEAIACPMTRNVFIVRIDVISRVEIARIELVAGRQAVELDDLRGLTGSMQRLPPVLRFASLRMLYSFAFAHQSMKMSIVILRNVTSRNLPVNKFFSINTYHYNFVIVSDLNVKQTY